MDLCILQRLFFKLFTCIVTLFYSLFGGVVIPSTEEPIKAMDPDDVKMVFATIADPQVSNYLFDRYRVFQSGCIDLRNAECDFDAIVGLGDMAENGLAEEYQLVYDELCSIDTRFIMATGNHDLRLRLYSQSSSRFTQFTNALNGDTSMSDSVYAEGKLAYSETINGYKFIVMGSDKTEFEEAYISEAQLEWLDSELTSATANGNPVFVVLHQPLKLTHDLPNTWGNGTNKDAGSVGDQSDDIKAILAKHAQDSTVVLLTGHLHSGFGDNSYEEIEGFYSINIPSFTIENKDGSVNGKGLTFICEVYEDEIVFRARNVQEGKWIPECNITIPVK